MAAARKYIIEQPSPATQAGADLAKEELFKAE
jgi:hypothetical protein